MKRICSLLLALVMVFGLLPATASANQLDNGLEYMVYEDHVEITGYTGDATEVVIPDEIEGLPVTVIGRFAFSQCSILTSINLPKTVTQINEYAFSRCTNLTSISLPGGLISIATDVFSGCSSLTSISIPDSVTRIGSNAFSNCSSLTSISIPDGVTSIGTYTFSGCTSLTSISIPDSITHIYGDAFKNCTSLTSIDLSDGLVMIAGYAFRGCSNLTSISIPGSVKELGACVFSDCTSLSSIYFVGDPPYMVGAFSGLTATAYYPAENPAWAPHTMMNAGGSINWISYESEHTHNYVAIVTAPTCTEQGYTTYTCECGESYVSDYVDALGHHYENGVCTNCGICKYPALELETDLVITSSDDGYTYVTFTPETSGSYVFYNKDTGDTDAALYTADMVELAYSDDCWEDHGFHSDFSFCITYDLEAGQTYVLGAAFLSGKIADMTIRVDRNHNYEIAETREPTCTEEGAIIWVCADCGYSYTESLPIQHSYEETITKEPTCTEEGEAIYTCTICGDSFTEALPAEHRYEETIIKEPTCTEEGEAIYTCTICGYSYTGTVDPFLWFEFYSDHVIVGGWNGNPTELVIPAEYEGLPVTGIGDCAFWDCDSLTSISIPDSVTYIGDVAFNGCTSLTNISLPDNVTYIGYQAFYECTGLTSFSFPTGISSVSNCIFWGCTNLTSVTIPEGVTSIDFSAFVDCTSLVNVSLPDGLTFMGESIFNGCSSLTSIEFPEGVTSIGEWTFYGCPSLTSIRFMGDAPEIADYAFVAVTATAHYPAGNPTWTEDVMQNYGGTITWVAYDPNAPVNPFTDVPAGCWYEAPVLWALDNGITSGTSETTFAPGNQCLRAHVVTFLWNAEKTPEPAAASSSFSDVPAGAWYEKPVLWAVEKGITSGVSPTKFGAGDVCNRYQVVFFLWKAAGSPEPKTTVNPFTDVNPGHFFYKAVLWAVENGITSGTSDTTFSPTQPCNRAQVVTFLYAAYN